MLIYINIISTINIFLKLSATYVSYIFSCSYMRKMHIWFCYFTLLHPSVTPSCNLHYKIIMLNKQFFTFGSCLSFIVSFFSLLVALEIWPALVSSVPNCIISISVFPASFSSIGSSFCFW